MHSDEADKINDAVKTVMHRLAARAINNDPEIINQARVALQNMERRLGHAPYMDEWRSLLRLEPSELRRLLTARSETMDRLRKSSPFLAIFKGPVDFRDPDLRSRIWRIARRIHNLRITGKDAPWPVNRSAA